MKAKSTASGDAAQLALHLLALLERIPRRVHGEDVHQLRTTARRLEVWLAEPPAKVARGLKKLRKEAGSARDLDVHLGLLETPLRSAASPTFLAAQQKLVKVLTQQRGQHRKQLRSVVAEVAPTLRERLPRVAEQALSPAAADEQKSARCCERALRKFLRWTRNVPEEMDALHRLRIETKKLRYSLEPLREYERAAKLAEQLKLVQDAIGEWHDWVTLEQLAARELPSAEAALLLPVLESRSAREYRKARQTVAQVRARLSRGKQQERSNIIPLRKAG